MKKQEFYTAQELVTKLRVDVMTIYRYIRADKIKAYKKSKNKIAMDLSDILCYNHL